MGTSEQDGAVRFRLVSQHWVPYFFGNNPLILFLSLLIAFYDKQAIFESIFKTLATWAARTTVDSTKLAN